MLLFPLCCARRSTPSPQFTSRVTTETDMNSPIFSLQEDLEALAELLSNPDAARQVGTYLQRIQTAPSKDQLGKWLEQVTGYVQALHDVNMLNEEQSILLRELVTRALMRNALK